MRRGSDGGGNRGETTKERYLIMYTFSCERMEKERESVCVCVTGGGDRKERDSVCACVCVCSDLLPGKAPSD